MGDWLKVMEGLTFWLNYWYIPRIRLMVCILLFNRTMCVLYGTIKLTKAMRHLPLQASHGASIDGTLQWHQNGRDNVSNHQSNDCLLNRLFKRRSKKTSKLCVTGLSVGNSSGTGEFPARRASNTENVSIWWRHHDIRNPISDPHGWVTWCLLYFGEINHIIRRLNWYIYLILACIHRYTTLGTSLHLLQLEIL